MKNRTTKQGQPRRNIQNKAPAFKNAEHVKSESQICVSFGGGKPAEIDGNSMVVIRGNADTCEQTVCESNIIGNVKLYRWGEIRELRDGSLCEIADIVIDDGDILKQVARPISDKEARGLLLERVPLLARLFNNTETSVNAPD